MSLFYIAGYIIRKDVNSSDDLLLNDTIFLPPKVRRRERENMQEVMMQCLCFCLKFVISICQKYRSNIFLKNHFLYTSPF